MSSELMGKLLGVALDGIGGRDWDTLSDYRRSNVIAAMQSEYQRQQPTGMIAGAGFASNVTLAVTTGIRDAEGGIAEERLSGNVVKKAHWQGELAAYRYMEDVINDALRAEGQEQGGAT